MSESGNSSQFHQIGSQGVPSTSVNPSEDLSTRLSNMKLEPLRKKCKQCHFEAVCWFYASLISAIVATLSIICLVALTVYFVLSKDIASSEIIKIILISSQSIISGTVTALIFFGKRYADKNEKYYLEKLDRRLNNTEVISNLITIINDSKINTQKKSDLVDFIMRQLTPGN